MWKSSKDVGGGVGSGKLGLYLISVFVDRLFTISRNWLTLGGTIPPESARPQRSKPQNTENKGCDSCSNISGPACSPRTLPLLHQEKDSFLLR